MNVTEYRADPDHWEQGDFVEIPEPPGLHIEMTPTEVAEALGYNPRAALVMGADNPLPRLISIRVHQPQNVLPSGALVAGSEPLTGLPATYSSLIVVWLGQSIQYVLCRTWRDNLAALTAFGRLLGMLRGGQG
jgi:hypothetical protein